MEVDNKHCPYLQLCSMIYSLEKLDNKRDKSLALDLHFVIELKILSFCPVFTEFHVWCIAFFSEKGKNTWISVSANIDAAM